MDLGQLEFAANLIFELCRQHPELCPHHYLLVAQVESVKDGIIEKRYVCDICGHEETRTRKDKSWL